jgi:hypothetical protein
MQYDFSLAAGAAQSFDVVGKFIKYQYGTGMIRVRMSMGEYVDLLPGQGVFSVDYTRFTVTDRSNANNAGALLAGDFDFRDSRITGDVSIIDGSKSEVLAGTSFVQNRSGYAGVAGMFNCIQLFNPAASSKYISINSVSLFSAVDSDFYLLGGQVELAGILRPSWNKNIGAPDSVAYVKYADVAVQPVPTELPGALTFGKIAVKAAAPTILNFKKPIVLRKGYGFAAISLTANNTVGWVFDFEEF